MTDISTEHATYKAGQIVRSKTDGGEIRVVWDTTRNRLVARPGPRVVCPPGDTLIIINSEPVREHPTNGKPCWHMRHLKSGLEVAWSEALFEVIE